MKWLLIVVGLIAVLAAAGPAGAQGLLLIESTSHVDISAASGHENLTLHYVVSQEEENALQDSVHIYGAVSGVNVSDAEGALFHSERMEGGFTVVTFNLRETLRAGDRSTVTVEFAKDTSTTGTDHRYEIRYMWGTTPSSSHIIATLPQEYTLYGTTENASSTSSSGAGLQLMWAQVQENQFFTAVTFGESTADGQDGGQPQTNPVPLYVLLAAAVSIVMAGAFLKIRASGPEVRAKGAVRPRRLSRDDIRKMMLMLTPHERNVMKVLLKRDNLTQRMLCDRTGIPKATMSRVLQRLENKGIVSRAGYMASKRVLLTKWARRWRV